MKTQILNALAPLLDPLETELAKLEPRERVLVGIGAVAVALALLYFAIWRPVAHLRSGNAQRLADARDVAAQLERAGALVPRNAGPAQASGGSLLSTVDEASKSGDLGKSLSRLSPDGDTRVHAWVEEVQFDSLMRWIYALQTRYGVRVDSVEVEQQPTPGVVNGRLTLVKAS